MNLSLSQLMKNVTAESAEKLRKKYAPGTKTNDETAEYMKSEAETVEVLKALMTNHRENVPQKFGVTRKDGKRFLDAWERGAERSPLIFKEALASNDAPVIFKRVISDVLQMPKEQEYIGQTILSRTIRIDGVRSARFPAIGAIVAADIAEGADYPEQNAAFSEHMLELKVQKAGVKIAINEEVIEDSLWDIFGLYVTMVGSAMDRWKEEKIFREALDKSWIIFDNAINDAARVTNGQGADGSKNGSLDFRDLMLLFGGVLSNGYTPTDLVLHPLAWIMLARDPRLLFQLLTTSNYQQSVPMPDLNAGAIQKNLPFGTINVVVTPQMRFLDSQVVNLLGTNQPSNNITDILCLDRKSSLVVLQREDKTMEEFTHQDRDVHCLKAHERYAVGALDEGRGMTSIKNIILTENLRPVFNVGMGVVS